MAFYLWEAVLGVDDEQTRLAAAAFVGWRTRREGRAGWGLGVRHGEMDWATRLTVSDDDELALKVRPARRARALRCGV